MQELVDLKNVYSLRLQFHNKVKDNLLKLFTLNAETKKQVENIDFENYSFSPDFYCLYFQAYIDQNRVINHVISDLLLSNNKAIDIIVVKPKLSFADNHIAKSEYMRDEAAHFSAPSEGAISKSKSNLQEALNLLSSEKLSGLGLNLLNSIAIYAGDGEIPTSASGIFCQGRIYVQNVGDSFPMFYYLDMLVHEIAHQHFNMIQNLFNLISDYRKTFLSYAKNQFRPIYGILHGAFVLYRLIDFYLDSSKLLKKFSIPYEAEDYHNYLNVRFFQIPFNYDFRLEIYKQKLEKTILQLDGSDALTKNGQEFIIYLKEFYTRLHKAGKATI